MGLSNLEVLDEDEESRSTIFGIIFCKAKELGIWHVVAQLPEDELVDIVLWLIPVGWKCMMMCTNSKPLEHSIEELVEYLKGVECLENENSPERSNQNNNNSSGLKKTKKSKHKHHKDEESHDATTKNTSNKKSHKLCKLCKMFGGNAELHITYCCNKKNLLSGLLDGDKKKCMYKAKKE
eukprot:15356265-Ditylum_brightwellii.AAC.1